MIKYIVVSGKITQKAFEVTILENYQQGIICIKIYK